MTKLTELETLHICRECTRGIHDLPRRTSKKVIEMIKQGKCPFFSNAPLLNADECAVWLKAKTE